MEKIYKDENGDFWRWDPVVNGYRAVDYHGKFYGVVTHPVVTYEQLSDESRILTPATESDIIWRTLDYVLEVLENIARGM